MKRINLYPQHALIVQSVGKRMAMALGAVLSVAVVFSVLGYSYLELKTVSQQSRLDFLQSEIGALDIQIKQIAEVQGRTDVLLARKKVIEKLQFNRGQAVLLMNELTRQIPDGVQLRSIEQQQETLKVIGWALSNENVSQFMKNLESSARFEPPRLVEIKAVSTAQSSQRVQEFQLTVKMPAERAEERGVKTIERVESPSAVLELKGATK